MIVSSRVYVNDVPCEFIPGQVTRIEFNRGWEADRFMLRVSKGKYPDLKLAELSNPVKITLICADKTSRKESKLVLKKWFILSRKRVEKGWVLFEVADVRWRQNWEKLTKQYNVRSYGGLWRKDSLKEGTTPWRALEATEDACKELGYEVVRDLDPTFVDPELTANLGNSEGGGWFAAEQAMFGPALIGPTRCDPVTNEHGQLVLTDRLADKSSELKKFIHIGGDVSTSDMHWQKIEIAEFHVEKRIERRLRYYSFANKTSAQPQRDPRDPEIINVIPKITREMQSAGGTPEAEQALREANDPAKVPFVELEPYVRDNFIALSTILKRWFKKRLYEHGPKKSEARAFAAGHPDADGNVEDTADLINRWDAIEDNVRQCLWRTWKIKVADDANPNVVSDEIRSRFCDLQLGRLQEDGTTKAGGVYANYVSQLRVGFLKNANDKVLDQKFSKNIPFSTTIQAPWSAQWLSDHREDLIFQLIPGKTPINRRGAELGALSEDLGFIDKEAVKQGKGIKFETQGELNGDLTLFVYFNGLWVGNEDRTYKDTRLMFPGGAVNKAVFRIDDITANFGFDGTWPGKLLNADEVNEKIDARAEEIRLSFEDGNAGFLKCGGVDVITKGKARVAGDVHSMAIVIGERAPFSIDTHILVHAAARPGQKKVATTEPGLKRGKKPKGII